MSNPASIKKVIRSHKKSRMGCVQCKKRRIKCDERRPVCSSCERRTADCVFIEHPRPSENDNASDSLPKPEQMPTIARHQTTELQLARKSPTPPPFSTLDMSSFKLFHHWCTDTSYTLAHSSSAMHGVQYTIPQLAFGQPGLMHVLLAIAASHMHHLFGLHALNADLDYNGLSIMHKSSAAQHIRTIQDPDIHLLLIGFLTVLEYADTSGRDIFSLVTSIYNNFHDRFFVKQPMIAAMGLYSRKPGQRLKVDIYTQPEYQQHVKLPFPQSLNSIHLPASEYAWPEPEEVQDPAISETYRRVVEALTGSWYLFQRQGSEITAAVSWFAQFSEEFHTFLVIERRQRALVLLYHYCSMLTWLTQQPQVCWWASGQTGLSNYAGHVWSLLNDEWVMCVTTAATFEQHLYQAQITQMTHSSAAGMDLSDAVVPVS
ncbi:transcription factor [Marasmius tenuissimus]|uniref:Transcription factor n=1 Tax=Marasmius tenuissimus TaxID=585030 RepID=A0ABR3A5Q8_9AGAR